MLEMCPMCEEKKVEGDTCTKCAYKKGIKCGTQIAGSRVYLCDDEHDPSVSCNGPARPAGYPLEAHKSI